MASMRRLANTVAGAAQPARLARFSRENCVRATVQVRLMSDGSDKKDKTEADASSKKDNKDSSSSSSSSSPSFFSRLKQSLSKPESSSSTSTASSTPTSSSGPVSSLLSLLSSLKSELLDSSTYFQKAEPYRAPVDRRRSAVERPVKPIEQNDEATGVVLHETSKWQSQWKNVTENNPVLDKLFEMKMKYDESDNIVIRGARSLTDKLAEGVGSVLEDDDSKVALAEIYRLDPNFDKDRFTLHCERNVCPAVLEAYIAGDVSTLKEWCAEACFNVLAASIDQRRAQGVVLDSRILDLRNVEVLMGRMMDEGPVLILSFQTQQVKCLRDKAGAIIEGGEDHIERCWYVLAMRRNPNIFDPYHAWQVLEISEQHTQETW